MGVQIVIWLVVVAIWVFAQWMSNKLIPPLEDGEHWLDRW